MDEQNINNGSAITIYKKSESTSTPPACTALPLGPTQVQDNEVYNVISRYSSCSAACRLSGSKHYHCRQCNYSTDKNDRIKKHLNTHKLQSNKDSKAEMDDKEVCKQHFTVFKRCYKKDCTYDQNDVSHVHCNICQ